MGVRGREGLHSARSTLHAGGELEGLENATFKCPRHEARVTMATPRLHHTIAILLRGVAYSPQLLYSAIRVAVTGGPRRAHTSQAGGPAACPRRE